MKPVQIITIVVVCLFLGGLVYFLYARQRKTLAFAKSFAAAAGLEFSPKGELAPATWELSAGLARKAWGFMTGSMAGGPALTLAYYDITVRAGRSTTSIPHTVAVVDLPAAGGFVSGLSCAPHGGLPQDVAEIGVESAAFAKRHSLGTQLAEEENRVRQIFSPTFVVWLTEESRANVCFDFRGQTLCVWAWGYLNSTDALDAFAATANGVAKRIEAEATEG